MRLAILSDIHEDLPSLSRAIKKAESQGYDRMICLGDICGFSHPFYRYRTARSASGCLDLVRRKCDVIIPGNHDMHAAFRIPVDSQVFDFPEQWYEFDAATRAKLAGQLLWTHNDDLCAGFSHDDLEFIRKLPEYHVLETEQGNILFSHYAHPNLSGFGKKFYRSEADFTGHFQFMESHGCQRSFIGHTHPRGYFMVTPAYISYLRKRHTRMETVPLILGVPPVTRHMRRWGFCIFDTESSKLKLCRF